MSDLYTKSFYCPKASLTAKTAYVPPFANQHRVDYSAPFFTTPASEYKTYPLSSNGVLTFSNRAGNIYKMRDYNYAVVQPANGNPSVVLYVKDPDVFVARNDNWFLVR
jgi:hypothetical protein